MDHHNGGLLVWLDHYIHDALVELNELYISILCGGIAGICAKTVIAPAERIKMSFQVDPTTPFSYREAWKRTLGIIKTNGVKALWKGHSTTIIRVAPYAGLHYGFHDAAELQFQKHLQTEQLPYIYKFMAGSFAGVGSTLMTYPLDVLRVRLALGGSWKSSTSQGGLFQGLTPTLIGIIPYAGIGWCVKQTLGDYFIQMNNRKPYLTENFLINSFAGLCGQFITYPLDVVRRRMQIMKQVNGNLPKCRDVLYKLYEIEGWRGLTKGFSLNIIKGPITMAISFTTYDLLRKKVKTYLSNEY